MSCHADAYDYNVQSCHSSNTKCLTTQFANILNTPPSFSGGKMVNHASGDLQFHSVFLVNYEWWNYMVVVETPSYKMCVECFNHSKAWWSIWIAKGRPSKCTLRTCTVILIARHSFSTIVYFTSLGRSLREKYVFGCSSPFSPRCVRIAPSPYSDMSVCNTNSKSRTGLLNTGPQEIKLFNLLKTLSHSADHTIRLGPVFFVRFVKTAILE